MRLGGIPEEDLPPEAEVQPEFMWIWRAWRRLSADRPHYGGGMGPAVPGDIPWSLARQWAEHHDMTKGEFNFMDRCFQAMDRVYRSHVIEQMSAKSDGRTR